MLQFIRDKKQGLLAKIVVAIIAIPFALFGVESFISASGANDAASVNGDPVSISELTRAMQVRKNNILAQMGENADPAALTDDLIRGPVLEMLIQQTLMRQTSADLGIAVSDATLDANIVNTETFQVEGKFSAERYRAVLSSNGLSPVGFKQLLQDDLQMRQLMDGITRSSFISAQELNLAARYVGETRSIDYVTLPLVDALEKATVSEDAIKAYYDENTNEFMTQESVELEYILVSRADFSPEVSDDDIRAEYQRQIDNMQAGLSRGAAHIMLELGSRDEDQAIAELESIKAELLAGADFAELAKKYSEDTFSAQEGGDIGDTTGDVFPAEFETALASLELNEVSDPVVSEGTVHLIKLVRLEELPKPSFEEKYDTIKRDLAVVEAEPLYIEALDKLADMSFNSVGLKDAADELGLTLSRSDKVTRKGAGGIFENEKLLTAAFSDELINQGHNSQVIEISADQSVVVRVAQHFEPEQLPFADVSSAIAARLKNQVANQTLQANANSLIERMKAGEPFTGISSAMGLELNSLANIDRRGGDQPRIVQAAFAMPVNGVGYQMVSLGMQGLAVIRVSDVTPGDMSTLDEQELAALRNMLAEAAASADLAAYQASLRDNADVKLL